MTLGNWSYFLALEKQFIRTLDFVAFTSDNGIAYSNEFAKLLLLAGSEVDVVAKQLCQIFEPGSRAGTIIEYQKIITVHRPTTHKLEVRLPFNHGTRVPWQSWGFPTPEKPRWWEAYNQVKHHRNECFREANQDNVVQAISGLTVLLTLLSRSGGANDPQLETQFFQCGPNGQFAFMERIPGEPEPLFPQSKF